MIRFGTMTVVAMALAVAAFAPPRPVAAAAAGKSAAASSGVKAAPAKAAASGAISAPASGAAARGESAIFAGGCFWCLETTYEGRPGVLSVVSGYSGGKELNPTYEQVGSHATTHLEVIEVRFDPARITYAQLLDLFWHSIDPTQGDGQFCDRGDQYRSAIFYRGEAQRAAAEKSRREIEASGVLKKPIVTELRAAGKFWPAEDYHQDYWKKDPIRYRTYRFGCGRDQRLAQIWGKAAVKPNVH
jgi:methionine-S-sulfoxide reductase